VILVDTSLWVELLNRRPRARVREEDLLNFVTCGPVVQEVLQGLPDHPAADLRSLAPAPWHRHSYLCGLRHSQEWLCYDRVAKVSEFLTVGFSRRDRKGPRTGRRCPWLPYSFRR